MTLMAFWNRLGSFIAAIDPEIWQNLSASTFSRGQLTAVKRKSIP